MQLLEFNRTALGAAMLHLSRREQPGNLAMQAFQLRNRIDGLQISIRRLRPRARLERLQDLDHIQPRFVARHLLLMLTVGLYRRPDGLPRRVAHHVRDLAQFVTGEKMQVRFLPLLLGLFALGAVPRLAGSRVCHNRLWSSSL